MQNIQQAVSAALTPQECAAIAEIEATTSILSIVTRMTRMRFAAIAKFDNSDWVVCSVHDIGEMGINAGDTLPVEITLCSDFLTDPQALLLPDIRKSAQHRMRPVVKQYGLESYIGVPIFLPDGALYGALCALDSEPTLFENPDLADTLHLFARLIGCIFFSRGFLPESVS